MDYHGNVQIVIISFYCDIVNCNGICPCHNTMNNHDELWNCVQKVYAIIIIEEYQRFYTSMPI